MKHTLLTDQFGRRHTDLRVSVTDRCNLRCTYCVHEQQVHFLPRNLLLTFEEIHRVVRLLVEHGIENVRLTGGEPLVRKNIVTLVEMLAGLPGLKDLAMTTNGILLPKYAQKLKQAGLHRINVSLDTLQPAKFEKITRRDALKLVMAGIQTALEAGFQKVKLNALAIKGVSEQEVIPLLQFGLETGVEVRFIEYMPLYDSAGASRYEALKAEEILRIVENHFGPVEQMPLDSSPAMMFRLSNSSVAFGIVPAVSKPFCSRCDRLRLTADGKLRNCLFSRREWDLRTLLRNGATDAQLLSVVRQAVEAKAAVQGHDPKEREIGHFSAGRPMYQIGG